MIEFAALNLKAGLNITETLTMSLAEQTTLPSADQSIYIVLHTALPGSVQHICEKYAVVNDL